MATTRAQENRAIRQQAIRDQLAAKGLIQQVLKLADELVDLSKEMDSNAISRYRTSIDANLRLVAKYLPDLKSVEMQVEGGMEHKFVIASEPMDTATWLEKHKPE